MMQNVKGGFIEKYTASAGNTQSKGTVKGGKNSFEDIITGSLKAVKSNTTGNSNDTKAVNSKDASDTAQDVKGNQDNSQVKSSKENNTAVGKADNTSTPDTAKETVKQVQGNNLQKEDSIPADQTEDNLISIAGINIQDLLNAIKNNIQQKLGISEDDFNKALESLGFTPLNLLDVNNLKQFLLKVSNNDDMSAFLTNEDLGNSLKELMNVCDTIQEQFSVSKEQLPVLSQPVVMDAVNKVSKDTQAETDAKVVTEPEKEIDITVIKSEKPVNARSNEESKSGSQKTEQNLSATELLIHNLAANTDSGEVIFTDQLAKVQQLREITTQILDAVKIHIKPEQTSMELQLNPENLGKINLTVVSREGVLTAKFVTGTETAKEAIESQLQVFKENLNNQGLKVENVEVTVSYSAFDQREQGFQEGSSKDSQERGRNRAFKGLDEINETFADTAKEELTSLNGLDQSTSSIDYTA